MHLIGSKVRFKIRKYRKCVTRLQVQAPLPNFSGSEASEYQYDLLLYHITRKTAAAARGDVSHTAVMLVHSTRQQEDASKSVNISSLLVQGDRQR